MKIQKFFVLLAAGVVALFAIGFPNTQANVMEAGEVIPIFTGTATDMLGRVVAGAPGTAIFRNGNNWVLVSPLADRGYMFLNLALDPATQKVSLSQIFDSTGGGNFTSYKTFTDFRAFLESIGFQKVARDALPPALVAEVMSKASSISTALASFRAPVFIILMTPMMFDDFKNQILPDAEIVG